MPTTPSSKPFKERAKLCPVVAIELTVSKTDIGLGRGPQGEHLWTLSDKTTATVKPRVNPIALAVRATSEIKRIEHEASGETSIEKDEIDRISEVNPQQSTKDSAFAEVIFQHLGSNCLECVLSTHCPSREQLAAQAHHPELRYENPKV